MTAIAVPMIIFLFYPAFLQEHCHLWLWHPTHHLRIHVAVSFRGIRARRRACPPGARTHPTEIL